MLELTLSQRGPQTLNKLSAASTGIHRVDEDGNAITNKILLTLTPEEYDHVLPKLELVRLKLHHVIYEAGESIKSAYFVNTGLISVVAVQPDGKSMKVGLIGSEGFAGLPIPAWDTVAARPGILRKGMERLTAAMRRHFSGLPKNCLA